MASSLNSKQTELLRQLCRERHPVATDQLDGRTLRSLLARGLVRVRARQVSPTDAGRAFWESPQPQSRRRKRSAQALPGRAAAILRAVEQLERAIPPEAEVRIGIIQAAADDVLAGLRKHAHNL
jgi:hypothetical protein